MLGFDHWSDGLRRSSPGRWTAWRPLDVLELDPIIEGYIDEAGNTGNDLDHVDQRNFFLACVVVPSTRATAFWTRCAEAWELAGRLTDRDPAGLEFKASDLYGRRGLFKQDPPPETRPVLDIVFEAMVDNKIYVCSEAVPKHAWAELLSRLPSEERDIPLGETAMNQFCSNLYELCSIVRSSLFQNRRR